MDHDTLYASAPTVPEFKDCGFYHTMELPGHGLVRGVWDLRQGVDDYLGHVPLAGQRVLEIGPASGFLTVEMERRGAGVVAVEVLDEPGWDFVPYPAAYLESVYAPRQEVMRRLKNSFWFTHAAHRSKAKLWYGDVYNLPEALGHFDVAVMGAVLLHCHSPLRIVEQCAELAETLIITDLFVPELAGQPVCRLHPNRVNQSWDTWWHFSPDFFVQFLGVLGFATPTVTTHVQAHLGRPYTFFTVVANRSQAGPSLAPAQIEVGARPQPADNARLVQRLQRKNARLVRHQAALEATLSWQLVQRLQRWRRVVAPPDSRRERLWRVVVRRARATGADATVVAPAQRTTGTNRGQ